MGVAGAAAGAVDETGAQAFRIVEQNFQHMAWGELRVAFAHGEVLRRLNETPGTLGILFKIHSHPSSDPPALIEAQADPAMSDLLLEHPRALGGVSNSSQQEGGTGSRRWH
jgi:hypothetical protein